MMALYILGFSFMAVYFLIAVMTGDVKMIEIIMKSISLSVGFLIVVSLLRFLNSK